MSVPETEFKSSTSLPLSRESDEWGIFEAFLQMTYRTSNVSLRSLWSVSSPASLAKFVRRTKGMSALVPTVIASQDIGENISLSAVCDRGFPDSPAGLRVQVGNLPLPSGFLDAGLDGTRKQGRGRRVFECLIARVGLGKTMVMDAPRSDEENLIEDLGRDYDSILVRPSEGEMDKHALTVTSSTPSVVTRGFLPPHAFFQTYIVRDGSQILPQYVCRFEVDTDKEEQLGLSPCQSCEESPATIWCAADSAVLCADCDEKLHAVNHLTQRHVRVPVNERARSAGPCAVREDKTAELWNEALGLAVCSETQREQFAKTAFEDIREAYKTASRAARQGDSEFETLKENILSRIKANDETIDLMDRMFADAEESCYRKIADALQKCLNLTEKRTSSLLDGERRLQTKLQFVQWSETLLEPFAHMLPPAEWMEVWLTHYRLTRKFVLQDETSAGENDTYEGEIKIDGKLVVKDGPNDKNKLIQQTT